MENPPVLTYLFSSDTEPYLHSVSWGLQSWTEAINLYSGKPQMFGIAWSSWSIFLVGGIPTPPKNMSQLGWWNSQLNGKIRFMFQTTNQEYIWSNCGGATFWFIVMVNPMICSQGRWHPMAGKSLWHLVSHWGSFRDVPGFRLQISHSKVHLAVCQNLVPLVNIKIAGKWMFIPLKMVCIGIDPYPFQWPQIKFEGLLGCVTLPARTQKSMESWACGKPNLGAPKKSLTAGVDHVDGYTTMHLLIWGPRAHFWSPMGHFLAQLCQLG